MNQKKPSGVKTIFWWVVWIALTIISFFAAAFFWTPIIAQHFGSIRELRTSIIWITAVFGTWLVFLVPLIIAMYARVDKAYEDARIKRENAANRFRSIDIPRAKRLLSSRLSDKLKSVPKTIESGHLVTVTLKNGKQFPYVFVGNRSEILGIYNQQALPFTVEEIADIEPDLMQDAPKFLTPKWLRVDGVTVDKS